MESIQELPREKEGLYTLNLFGVMFSCTRTAMVQYKGVDIRMWSVLLLMPEIPFQNGKLWC